MIKITQETANEFIKAILPMAKNCVINIMDINGVIVASSDVSRINIFHTGAQKAIEEKRTVKIYKNQVELFPGSKEGINIPIVNEGEVLGVVGIYGDPNLMEDAANLLSVCVGLYLKLLISQEKLNLDKNARYSFLAELLKGEEISHENILKQSEALDFKLSFPVRVILLKAEAAKNEKISLLKKYDKVEKTLSEHNLIDYKEDLFGIYLDDIVILKKEKNWRNPNDAEKYLDDVRETVRKYLNMKCRLAVSESCFKAEEISVFYSETKDLLSMGYDMANMEKYKYKFAYLFKKIPEKESERIIAPMYRKMVDYFHEENIHEIMYTLKFYVDCDFNINEAAKKLGIHKNTLVYRVNKVLFLLGLENETAFLKNFFIQGVLYHYINLII